MEQMTLKLAKQGEQGEPDEAVRVALDHETTETVVELMARALIAVVLVAEEASDER
jgi:hypothetical protein